MLVLCCLCLACCSGLYGTFLCDTERRRSRLKIKQRTVSIWTVVLNNRKAFVNANYAETREPLWPSLAPTKVRRSRPQTISDILMRA